MLINIAIDGPSGAGKSTLARAAAKQLGLIYVDTGAIYRTVGLAAKRAGLPLGAGDGVVAMLPSLEIDMAYDGEGRQRMYLNGEDVSEAIREPEISMYASDVSAVPEVRAFLLQMQRPMAARGGVIMDGRDIGTVVLPGAPLKVFLTASEEARAERRCRELREKGIECTVGEVLRDMRVRDENDSNRAAAPLRKADDAVLLDTTELDFEQSLAALTALIKEKFGL